MEVIGFSDPKGFNGAALRRARSLALPVRCAVKPWALQRGRAPESAESSYTVQRKRYGKRLQRGRAPESAESCVVLFCMAGKKCFNGAALRRARSQ